MESSPASTESIQDVRAASCCVVGGGPLQPGVSTTGAESDRGAGLEGGPAVPHPLVLPAATAPAGAAQSAGEDDRLWDKAGASAGVCGFLRWMSHNSSKRCILLSPKICIEVLETTSMPEQVVVQLARDETDDGRPFICLRIIGDPQLDRSVS
jgi:hypothetical protein